MRHISFSGEIQIYVTLECLLNITKVTSESDVSNAMKTAKQKFGKLDVTVNCAGIAPGHMTYSKKTDQPFPLDVFKQTIEV